MASLVLGIVGLLAWCAPLFGAPIGIVGLVLGLGALQSPKRGVALAGTAISIIVLVLTIANASIGAYIGFTGQHPLLRRASPSYSLDRLSTAERSRFREMIAGVLQDEVYPTRQVREEFWAILGKSGVASSEDEQMLKDEMVGTTTVYMRYFYEDALWALKTGRPFKSVRREEYEERLVALGAMNQWRITGNENLIEQIAARQPVRGILFDEDAIKATLADLEPTGKRVELLFTRP